ncbi:MAG: hypothetical protein WCO80_00760 [Betaproteobacteria bacterium]
MNRQFKTLFAVVWTAVILSTTGCASLTSAYESAKDTVSGWVK